MIETDHSPEAASLSDVVHELRRLRGTIAAGHAELLAAPQAAALLGISARTLPPGIRVGSGRRWKRADLMDWIQRQIQKSR